MDAPDNALPRTGYECEIIIFSENEIKWDSDAYGFHGSIKANLDQKVSIWRKYCHRRTILTFRRGASREQCCDFSMDLEEKATFVPFSEISYL